MGRGVRLSSLTCRSTLDRAGQSENKQQQSECSAFKGFSAGTACARRENPTEWLRSESGSEVPLGDFLPNCARAPWACESFPGRIRGIIDGSVRVADRRARKVIQFRSQGHTAFGLVELQVDRPDSIEGELQNGCFGLKSHGARSGDA